MYLESSKDILFLVLAFCALMFTMFACWGMYYVIAMLRDGSNLIGEIRDRLHAIDSTIRGVKEKLEHSASYLGMVAAGVKMLIEILSRNKEKVAEKAEEAATKLKKKVKKVVEEMTDEQ